MLNFEVLRHSLKFKDIKGATKNFAPENIIKKKEGESVYQGSMMLFEEDTNIVARRIYHEYYEDEGEKVEMQVQMLSTLKHKNLVSFIGFCYNEDEQIFIYKKEANGCLN